MADRYTRPRKPPGASSEPTVEAPAPATQQHVKPLHPYGHEDEDRKFWRGLAVALVLMGALIAAAWMWGGK